MSVYRIYEKYTIGKQLVANRYSLVYLVLLVSIKQNVDQQSTV